MRRKRGFTLVEMIVAIALFAVVMMIAVGSLLALTAANRKAQAIQSVMNNLNITLDGMVRALRMGYNYQCVGSGSVQKNADPQTADCAAIDENTDTGQMIKFSCNVNSLGCYAPDHLRWAYRFICPRAITNGVCSSGGYIEMSQQDGSDGTWVQVTAPEVSINYLRFRVVGTERGSYLPATPDTIQPKVIVTVKGTAGARSTKTVTTFNIQATAVQRLLDL